MSSVDTRIVDMRFNNQQFERGVRTSVKSLEDLKKGLELDKSAQSLSNLSKTSNSFSLEGISRGVEAISNKFSALGIIGITVLQNLTNQALEAGKRITSALTLDSISDGFNEYETKMNSIQTLLSNTSDQGTTLEDVNKALAELNEYSDQTIYNFAQMTDNASKFAAAGLGLEDSVTVVKGLANVAAGFGVDAQKMAGATYQMTQALSAGVVKLMDWNSLQQAGMGGVKLQNEMKKTAKEMGIFVDETIAFRDSLEQGWLTAGVFTKTMARMAEDKNLLAAATNVTTFTKMLNTMKEALASGWASSWEALLGGAERSKELWTALANSFSEITGASAKARNAMLEFWAANGGRTYLLEGLSNVLESIGRLVLPIQEAFRSIFPPTTSQKLIDITKGFRDLTANLMIGEETSNNLKRTFKGLFALLDIGWQALSAIGNGLKSMLQYIMPVTGGFLDLTGSIGDFLVNINEALKSSNKFNRIIEGIGSAIKPIANMINNLVGSIGLMLSSIFSFGSGFDGAQGLLEKSLNFFGSMASRISETLTNLINTITKGFSSGDFGPILSIINSGVLATIFLGIRKLMNNLREGLSGGITGNFLGKFHDIMDGVTGSLTKFQNVLRANVLLQIAIAIGILAASLALIASIDAKKLETSLAAMTVMFIELFGSMVIFERLMGGSGFLAIGKITLSMIALSAAVLLLSFALTRLSKLDWVELSKGLLGVAGLALILVGSAKLLEGASGGLVKSAFGFMLMGGALLILSSSLIKLGALDLQNIGKGLLSIGVLMAELALFMKVANLSGMGISQSAGLILMATSILVLGAAVKQFSDMNSDALIQGLTAVAVVLAQVGLFVKMTGNSSGVITTALGLVILSSSLLIFTAAITQMGGLSLDTLGKGLATMAGALLIVGVAISKIPAFKAMATGAALVVIATSLLILSHALTIMGGMSIEAIGKALLVLAGSMIIMTVSISAMQASIGGIFALFMMADALSLLAPMLIALGNMSLQQIGIALLALAGALAVLGLAGWAAAPLTPIILSLSGALFIFSVSLLAISGAVFIFALSMASIAATLAAGGVSLGLFMASASSLLGLIPVLFVNLVKGFIEGLKALGTGMKSVEEAVTSILRSIIKIIVDVMPEILAAIGMIVVGILKVLAKYIPDIVSAGMDLIIALLDGINNNIYKITDIVIDIIVRFVYAVIDSLPVIIQAGVDLILAFINGVADGLRKNTDKLILAMDNLISAILLAAEKALKAAIPGMFNSGVNLIKGLINGMGDMVVGVGKAAGEVGDAVIKSIKNVFGIASPSTVFIGIGQNLSTSLGSGLTMYSQQATTPAKTLGENMGLSVAQGIDNSTGEAEKATWRFTGNINKAFEKSFASDGLMNLKPAYRLDDEKPTNMLLSLSDKIKDLLKKKITDPIKVAGEKIAPNLATGIKDGSKKAKTAFEMSLEWIDERKYYGQISLQQELEAFERIQSRYIAGTDERKKADREVYRVKQEIAKKVKDDGEKASKDSYDHSKNWIETQKFYNQLSLQEELAAQERIKNNPLLSAENRVQVDKDIYTLKNAILKDSFDNSVNWIDNEKYYNRLSLRQELAAWERVQSRYLEGTEERKRADRELYRLKNEINKGNEEQSKKLAAIHKDEKDKLLKLDEDYYSKVKAINEKLKQDSKSVDDEYNNALKSRTDALYSSYGLFDAVEKQQPVSGKKLITNLQDQVTEFETWQKTLKDLAKKGVNDGLIKELETIGPKSLTQIQALNRLSAPELDNYASLWQTKHNDAKTQAVGELEGLRKETLTKIDGLTTDANKELDTLKTVWTTQTKEIKTEAVNQITEVKSEWARILGETKTATKTECQEISKTIKDEMLKPDWFFQGASIISAFTSGMKSKATEAMSVISSIVENTMNSNMDMNPTITPVVDGSLVESWSKQNAGLFQNGSGSLANSAINLSNKVNPPSSTPNWPAFKAGGGPVSNNFNIASMNVRNDSDVYKVARELDQLIIARSRG